MNEVAWFTTVALCGVQDGCSRAVGLSLRLGTLQCVLPGVDALYKTGLPPSAMVSLQGTVPAYCEPVAISEPVVVCTEGADVVTHPLPSVEWSDLWLTAPLHQPKMVWGHSPQPDWLREWASNPLTQSFLTEPSWASLLRRVAVAVAPTRPLVEWLGREFLRWEEGRTATPPEKLAAELRHLAYRIRHVSEYGRRKLAVESGPDGGKFSRRFTVGLGEYLRFAYPQETHTDDAGRQLSWLAERLR